MYKKFIFCRDIKNKKYKVKIDQLNFRPAVYGLIFKGNKILLSRQGDGYDFPGGGVDKGEKLEDALKREVWEETGVKITSGDLVYVTQDFFISIQSRKRIHSILVYYLCKKPSGKISTKHFDGYEKSYLKAAEWIDLKDVKKLHFYNAVNSPKLIKQGYELYKRLYESTIQVSISRQQ